MNKGVAMKRPIFFFALILATVFQPGASEEKRLTTQQWLEDLEFVVSKLGSNHPRLFYKTDKAIFDSIVAESRREIAQSQSDLECYLALRKIVACIEDGHTGLLDNGLFDLLDLRFPFRVAEFTDGVYITVITKEYGRYLGSRLLSIDGRPIEEILAAIEKVVGGDNRFGRRQWALNGIPFARLLVGLKLIEHPDFADLELITDNGESDKLKIHSLSDNTPIAYGWGLPLRAGPTKGEYVSPSVKPGEKGTLHYQYQGDRVRFYWFEHLVKGRVLYLQFNQIMNQPDEEENFARFSTRLWDYVDRNARDIGKFIIDLRNNNGGNGTLIIPFLHQLIKRDFINKEGVLYVISGGTTYSAASIFLYELAVHTKATFIGEPDGCGSDLFSNSRFAGNLPNSGFPLWIASLQFTNRWPIGQTEYFMPHFPAAFSSRDYFRGEDPALDLIVSEDLRSVAEFAADEGAEAAVVYCQKLREKYQEYEWWTPLDPGVLERSNNSKGYALMEKGDWDRSHRVFVLNTLLFPGSSNTWDSLGEWCYGMKRLDLSLQYYKKSLELNPDNENAKQMIERIRGEQGQEDIDHLRNREQQPQKVMDVIGLRPGMIVGEAGAGSGYFTFKMSRRVGNGGLVYANDIIPAVLQSIDRKCQTERITNIRTVLGTEDDPRYPGDNLDMIVVFDCLFEFSQPVTWMRNAGKYLKPGGRLVIVDPDPAKIGSSGHFLSKNEIQQYGRQSGYSLLEADDSFLKSHMIIILATPQVSEVPGSSR